MQEERQGIAACIEHRGRVSGAEAGRDQPTKAVQAPKPGRTDVSSSWKPLQHPDSVLDWFPPPANPSF